MNDEDIGLLLVHNAEMAKVIARQAAELRQLRMTVERCKETRVGAEKQAEHFLAQREKLLDGVLYLADATQTLRERRGAWAVPVDFWDEVRKSVESLVTTWTQIRQGAEQKPGI